MKLFGKKEDKQGVNASSVIAGVNSPVPRRFLLTKKLKLILLIAVVVVAGAGAGYWYLKRHRSTEADLVNKSLQKNDQSAALEHARKALDENPDDLVAIETVATLTMKSNPKESRQLYTHALEIFKKIDNPDVDGKPAVTYMGAAAYAERAGLNDQAKKYYKKAIDNAKLNDVYDQSIIKQANDALARLK